MVFSIKSIKASELEDHISPKLRGLIISSHLSIDSDEETYQKIDYLLDGLLTRQVNHFPENIEKQKLYMGEIFTSPFFVFRCANPLDKSNYGPTLKLISHQFNAGDVLQIQ